MQKINTKSLSFRITLYTALCVLVVGVFSNVYLFTYLNGIITEKADSIDAMYLDTVKLQLDNNFKELYNVALLCANHYDISKAMKYGGLTSQDAKKDCLRAQAVMNDALSAAYVSSYIRKLLVFNENGLIVQASTAKQGSPYDFGEITATKLYENRSTTAVRPEFVLTSSVTPFEPQCLAILFIYYKDAAAPQCLPLDTRQYTNRLVMELRSKNIAQCSDILQKLRTAFEETPHTRDDAVSTCCDLYSLTSTVLIPLFEKETSNEYFTNISRMINRLNTFINYRQVKRWLCEFSQQVISVLEQMTSSKYELGEKVKRYVRENVKERIMLQDVADAVSISPSYLSALFKKEYGQNLVDYINAQKRERAKELIREGRYRIYEISYMLSFENAYYFTKVFKRHTGMTPKEYQHKVRGTAEE